LTDLSETQLKILQLLEDEGLADKRRMQALGQIVRSAEGWGTVRKTLMNIAGALGAGGVVVGAIVAFREWVSRGGG
jgi:hypothetical protein